MIKFKTIEGGKAPIKLNLADAAYDCYDRDIEIVRTKKGKFKLIVSYCESDVEAKYKIFNHLQNLKTFNL